MSTWTLHAGYPVVNVGWAAGAGKGSRDEGPVLRLQQQAIMPDSPAQDTAGNAQPQWWLPVAYTTAVSCLLVSDWLLLPVAGVGAVAKTVIVFFCQPAGIAGD